ncbi:MAG: Rrf2 family transcriptional regulator [Firmicutes bacterium]|nr:Rrf2 family transcriptional regulator [Bacillota bacterium]
MKLSTKARYGLRAAYVMAEHFGGEPISTAKIAAVVSVGEPYTEKLLGLLKKAGVAETTRGASGGFKLARSPEQITVGEVLRALEGNLFITDCVANNCAACCPNKNVFNKLYLEMNKVLNSMTLMDMLNDNKLK